MLHEIKSPDWPAFCQRVSQQRAGATVKLEVIESDGVKSELVASATLQGMVFGKADACNDAITLRLRNDREIVHEILEPIRLLLHPSGRGDYNLLQIESESGGNFVTFHPPIHAQMLEGLKGG